MLTCKVINNMPKCPYCSSTDLPKVVDIDMALLDGDLHYQVECKCLKCKSSSYYFLSLDLEKRKSVDKKSDRYKKYITDNSTQSEIRKEE